MEIITNQLTDLKGTGMNRKIGIGRVLIECVNVRSVEDRIGQLQARIREIDRQLWSESNAAVRVKLEGEWVETHMQILNFRYLIGKRLDAIMEQMYLGKQGGQTNGRH